MWFRILKAHSTFNLSSSGCSGEDGTSCDTLSLSYCTSGFHNIILTWGIFILFFPFSKMHEQCSLNIFFEGFRRDNSSRLLGACPFLLHLWSNCCLHVATGLDQNEQEWRRRDEGRWRWRKSLEDWQEHASALRFHVCPVQCYILACVSETIIMKRNLSKSTVLIYEINF